MQPATNLIQIGYKIKESHKQYITIKQYQILTSIKHIEVTISNKISFLLILKKLVTPPPP